jgi:2-methylcitrate dehydratase PrpD
MASLLGRGVVDWSRIEEDLGAAWAIENPGLTIKAYPACAGVQRAVAAALEIRDEVVRDPHAIQAIYVSATESLLDTLHIDIPEEGFGGKFSLRYCLAVALADGEVTVGSFSDGTLERPIVQELMAKTTIRVIPGGSGGRHRENAHASRSTYG